MASLYDLLCYHSLTSTDPLVEELLAYLPTRFPSHMFDYFACEHSSDAESVQSTDSSISAFYFDNSTFFPEYFHNLLTFYATPKFSPRLTGTNYKKWPPAENDPRPKRRARRPYSSRKTPDAASSSNCSCLSSPGGEQPEPLPAVETSQQIVAGEVGPQLTNKDLPRRLNKFKLPVRAPCISEKRF